VETGASSRLRFDRKDGVFVVACLFVLLGGAVVGRFGFSRAFPEASIDFRVTREEALRLAEKELSSRGFDLSGMKALVVFDHDDEAKVFLERTLGLAKANPLFGKTVPIWHWSLRWVKPLEKLEYRAYVSPGGEFLAFRRLLPEKQAVPDPGDEKARALAQAALGAMRGVDPGALRFIETTTERRPARVDRTYVWESRTVRFGDAALRYRVEVQGDRVGRSSVYLEVPEKWREDYKTLRSKNEAAGAVATLGLFLTFLAILAVFVERVRRKDVKWKWALSFAGVGAVLQFASSLNEMPVRLFDYETSDAWSGFLAKAVFGELGGAVLLGAVLLVLVASGEPLYREAYPGKPALGRILSLKGLQSKRFFRGLLLGYALTAFFFAYQVVFYIVAERVGAWAPADVPYSNLLGTSFPWLAVLLMGFVPATTEEFSSRMFSIPFAEKFLPRWAAIVVPALIWGFAHSAYPNQPFYIRGVEVGLAGILIGAVMLKADLFPLLVWHFTVDAVYTSLLLVRSSNPYFVISGAAAAGVLLLPMVVSVALYFRNGGFASEEDLSNAAVGSAPAPVRVEAPAPATCAPARRLLPASVALAVGLGVALLVLSKTVLPKADLWDGKELAIDRRVARKAADAFLKKSGDDPSGFFAVPLTATALPALEGADSGADLVPYGFDRSAERWLLEHGGVPLLSRWARDVFPGPVWQVRYARSQDQHGATVVVDGRTRKVVGFKRTFPEDEAGASPDEGVARGHAEQLLSSFGFDPDSFTVVAQKAETRKARSDHRVTFESTRPKERVGEAVRRVVVELAGEKPALMATGLKLPEEWMRQREKWAPATYVAVAWKVAGIGTLIGLLIIELVKTARSSAIPWRRISGAALLLTLPAAMAQVAAVPLVLRAFRPEWPMGVFSVFAAVGVLVGLIVAFGRALLALALIHAVRPDAGAAFRFRGADGPRALLAAAVAALLVFAARAFNGSLAAAWPLAGGLGAFTPPPGVETLFPAAVLLDGAVSRALLVAGAAAFAALLLKDALRHPLVRAGLVVVMAGAFAPAGARSLSELFVPLLGAIVVAAAFLAGIAALLQDDPRAYIFFSLFLAASGAARLASSGVASWVVSGVLVLVVAAAAAAARGFDRPAAVSPG
jgi:membrane protease YdiL (CAAX protease family)